MVEKGFARRERYGLAASMNVGQHKTDNPRHAFEYYSHRTNAPCMVLLDDDTFDWLQLERVSKFYQFEIIMTNERHIPP